MSIRAITTYGDISYSIPRHAAAEQQELSVSGHPIYVGIVEQGRAVLGAGTGGRLSLSIYFLSLLTLGEGGARYRLKYTHEERLNSK